MHLRLLGYYPLSICTSASLPLLVLSESGIYSKVGVRFCTCQQTPTLPVAPARLMSLALANTCPVHRVRPKGCSAAQGVVVL